MVFRNETEAIIVLYNPDLNRLFQCIKSVSNQVERVILVDNNSENYEQVRTWLTLNISNYSLVSLQKNYGIGKALNVAVTYLKDATKWILTLDQDSVVPSNMIEVFSKYAEEDNLAILCPLVMDERRYNNRLSSTELVTEIAESIQSGSLYNVAILKSAGGFNEWLFIDYVDYEYCYRIVKRGYKIKRINQLILNQEFGKLYDSKFKKIYILLWRLTKFSFFKKLSYFPEILPWRTFYTTRNRIYCLYYFSGIEKFKKIIALPFSYIKVVFRSRRRLETTKAIIKGTKEGMIALRQIKEKNNNE